MGEAPLEIGVKAPGTWNGVSGKPAGAVKAKGGEAGGTSRAPRLRSREMMYPDVAVDLLAFPDCP
jgi:hypothetical protein